MDWKVIDNCSIEGSCVEEEKNMQVLDVCGGFIVEEEDVLKDEFVDIFFDKKEEVKVIFMYSIYICYVGMSKLISKYFSFD